MPAPLEGQRRDGSKPLLIAIRANCVLVIAPSGGYRALQTAGRANRERMDSEHRRFAGGDLIDILQF